MRMLLLLRRLERVLAGRNQTICQRAGPIRRCEFDDEPQLPLEREVDMGGRQVIADDSFWWSRRTGEPSISRTLGHYLG